MGSLRHLGDEAQDGLGASGARAFGVGGMRRGGDDGDDGRQGVIGNRYNDFG